MWPDRKRRLLSSLLVGGALIWIPQTVWGQTECSECDKVLAVTTFQDATEVIEKKYSRLADMMCSQTEDQSREEASSGGGLSIPLFLDLNGHFDSSKFHKWYNDTCSAHSTEEWRDLWSKHSQTDNTAAVEAWRDCQHLCHSGLFYHVRLYPNDASQVTLVIENQIGGSPHHFLRDVILPAGVVFGNAVNQVALFALAPNKNPAVLARKGEYVPAGRSEYGLDRGGRNKSFQLFIETDVGTLSPYFPPKAAPPPPPQPAPPTPLDVTVSAKNERQYIGTAPLVIQHMDGSWSVDRGTFGMFGPDGSHCCGGRANGLLWGQAVIEVDSGPPGAVATKLLGWTGPCIAIPTGDVFVHINDQEGICRWSDRSGSCYSDNDGEIRVTGFQGPTAKCAAAAPPIVGAMLRWSMRNVRATAVVDRGDNPSACQVAFDDDPAHPYCEATSCKGSCKLRQKTEGDLVTSWCECSP
jgi:hypothetical protein